MSTPEPIHIFHETMSHSRRKRVVGPHIETVIKPIMETFAGKTFEEVYCKIRETSSKIDEIGRLTLYDLTAAMCRYHGTKVNRVYIVGNGPKRAIKHLGIPVKIQKPENLKYVEIPDLKRVLLARGYHLLESDNGDDYESYICRLQKTF